MIIISLLGVYTSAPERDKESLFSDVVSKPRRDRPC